MKKMKKKLKKIEKKLKKSDLIFEHGFRIGDQLTQDVVVVGDIVIQLVQVLAVLGQQLLVRRGQQLEVRLRLLQPVYGVQLVVPEGLHNLEKVLPLCCGVLGSVGHG
jgi:tetrahydromethanopterin S-methyltransferase subunit G